MYQMRSTNRATCRTIEYMDEFVNKYSEVLLLLNKAPSPMLEIEEDLDLEGEAVLQKEQAAEEDRRARARSRSRKRQQKKRDKFLRRRIGRYNSFSGSSYSYKVVPPGYVELKGFISNVN